MPINFLYKEAYQTWCSSAGSSRGFGVRIWWRGGRGGIWLART